MLATTIAVKVTKSARDEASAIVILGGTDSPGVVAALKADKNFRIVEASTDYKQLISDKRIRLAVEADPKDPRRIVTVRGAGYVFARDPR